MTKAQINTEIILSNCKSKMVSLESAIHSFAMDFVNGTTLNAELLKALKYFKQFRDFVKKYGK